MPCLLLNIVCKIMSIYDTNIYLITFICSLNVYVFLFLWSFHLLYFLKPQFLLFLTHKASVYPIFTHFSPVSLLKYPGYFQWFIWHLVENVYLNYIHLSFFSFPVYFLGICAQWCSETYYQHCTQESVLWFLGDCVG